MPNRIQVVPADLANPVHQQQIVELLDRYSRDPMGADSPLADRVRSSVVQGLREHPTTRVFLAYDDETAVGLAICFVGFSTFYARPLLNIHDFAVLPQFRGRGAGRAMLAAIEEAARAMDCCKLTLEVREDNLPAQRLYQSCGFDPGQEPMTFSFWTKEL